MLKSLVTASLLFASASSATTLLRVACGSNSAVTDSLGNIWQSDTGFAGGTSFGVAAATAEPFKHLRFATSFSYSFQLQAATSYTVTLRFLEPNKTAAGQRLFNVSANSVPQIISMDLFLLANGANHSYDKSFPITVGANGLLVLQFNTAIAGQNAVVSAIQIDDLPGTLPPGNQIRCLLGNVTAAQLSPALQSQEIIIAQGISGDFRPEHALLSETSRFDGNPPLYVSMGRPGTPNNTEMVERLQLGQEPKSWYFRPIAPQLSNQYDLVLNFSTEAANLGVAVGTLYWEICGYVVSPTAATLAGLASCSGGGSGTFTDKDGVVHQYAYSCDGLWRANVVLPNKAVLSIVGPSMQTSGGNWTTTK